MYERRVSQQPLKSTLASYVTATFSWLLFWCKQEEYSDEEDGQDEDLSAALATLRMQQESRTRDGGSKRPGQEAGGKGGSAGGASGDGPVETAIRTQVSHLIEETWRFPLCLTRPENEKSRPRTLFKCRISLPQGMRDTVPSLIVLQTAFAVSRYQ